MSYSLQAESQFTSRSLGIWNGLISFCTLYEPLKVTTSRYVVAALGDSYAVRRRLTEVPSQLGRQTTELVLYVNFITYNFSIFSSQMKMLESIWRNSPKWKSIVGALTLWKLRASKCANSTMMRLFWLQIETLKNMWSKSSMKWHREAYRYVSAHD